jgi:hypothetical protein
MTTPSNASSIDTLISGMKQLAQSGAGKDLRLSEGVREQYTKLIGDYRNALIEQRNNAAGLTTYRNVGTFWSAKRTKDHLIEDVTGADGFLASLDQYIAYLEEFENAVNAVFKRMQAEDKSS